ncbi:tRNA uridine(34) 5-carboxymethylaminomethyl modification radical SAM/GNAT enzyme Elp3 [Methanimicrococcus blatticola]|uniref:tRNA carboxymethyluridine synthase n=1 Tax=Methanimicrococcus blatticola TaxID=91560 RepID=A0A484F320_9EURY|nr:tRNA uridine(34) 5-carboxymethylaminomethyl modification radical SAM/GNAT enzyme Elp3 [Methanimicrococcus blatticola]MBZ3936043.1 tRNA uridine(34) 5-carboxymethylaminomethyl modification radical SAM/GNAT enzyme Elp3 [Methanimicrococcus blatticola]MCC2509345.1 tRNA uridine(34) 5-carboxymethylaminomethyl modification radical SAM/GNAT enzyme Elp3 [Methanimicrococcus blatticola]TDQ68229.1 elongator complex protein 3 [Methanimicrococcus blatticola]
MGYQEFDKSDEKFNDACREILLSAVAGEFETEKDLAKMKKKVCKKYGLSTLPSNGDIILRGTPDEQKAVRDVLQRKPVRTISGVAVIAAMTSPAPCPHGKCLPCPGGPDSAFESPQSYMGREPAAMRAFEFRFDPYAQVSSRLKQLNTIGHDVSKAELIIMGGTFSARSVDYQEWFVKRCLEAMNDHDAAVSESGIPVWRAEVPSYDSADSTYSFIPLEDVQKANETAYVRNVGMTLETRPDWAKEEHIDEFLKIGGTKVELGVQSVFEDVLLKMNRGHTVRETADANRRLRDSAFKVGFHMMPGLFDTDFDRDLEGFKTLFENPDFKPDYLKIYPTLVTEGTELCKMWQNNEYRPLDDENGPELVSKIKAILPKWTRLQRIQRDIPADQILAGIQKSNVRQEAEKLLHARGEKCKCIRCREVGHNILKGNPPSPENIHLLVEKYDCCGGLENFISFEDLKADVLVGFIRLRFPNAPHRSELKNTALIRELHVYGSLTPLGETADTLSAPLADKNRSWQHRGYGKELIQKAEEIAADGGYEKISIISGIGVREYYRKYGYEFDGTYMTKKL